ncbi:MAG: sigma-54 interaction domain-containing protein [bacterium]
MADGGLHEIEDKKELARLIDAGTAVTSTLDLDEVLTRIMQFATKIVGAEVSSLLLLNKRTNKLQFLVAVGETEDKIKEIGVMDVGVGIAGIVAKTGEPLSIADAKSDPRHYKEIDRQIGFETKSILCVPMKLRGEVIGVVEVINKIDGDAFTHDDMILLIAFANQAAVAIENATLYGRINTENRVLREALESKYTLIGQSPKMQEIYKLIDRVASFSTTVLLLGESGTGKELVAHAIHNRSPRRDKPFVCVNCAALAENLLESELFGHEKGAFTGAISRKIGKFEAADGGTIFLDEIGELSPALQAKLLRVLQERAFERVGGNKTIEVDVRVIAATNKDLERAVAERAFREDLYYRINVIPIKLPPLREHKEDIPLLVEYFLDKYSRETNKVVERVSPEAMKLLMEHDWQGNVRELANVIERAVVLSNGSEILPEHLPMRPKSESPKEIKVGLHLEEAQNAFRRQYITETLLHTGGNQSEASRILGIQRTYLSRLIREMKIELPKMAP